LKVEVCLMLPKPMQYKGVIFLPEAPRTRYVVYDGQVRDVKPGVVNLSSGLIAVIYVTSKTNNVKCNVYEVKEGKLFLVVMIDTAKQSLATIVRNLKKLPKELKLMIWEEIKEKMDLVLGRP